VILDRTDDPLSASLRAPGSAGRPSDGGSDVTYASIVLRVLLFAAPFVALAGLKVLSNRVDAGAGAGFAGLCLISVFTGVAIGLFADRLPGYRKQGERPTASRRAAPGAR
jgi:hypothetical protein